MVDITTKRAEKAMTAMDSFSWFSVLPLDALSSAEQLPRIGFLASPRAWPADTDYIQLALVSGLPLCQNSYSRSGYDATHIGKLSSPPLSGLCNTSEIPHAADTSQLN